MKNLFKNLMLVAVAAMAFTACTENNEEVNAVSKKTVLNGVVGFAEETRSGFSEETSTNDEGKTVYHSEWDGNESILVVCNGQAKTAPITKNDEGNANFTVEFDGELGDLYYVSVYSPASAFDQSGICTIPSEQTPRANSVDPAAHALSVSSTPVSAGSAYFAMQHSAAYGKMTVKGVEFAIDHVVVDLKGTYYSYDRELSYTINADNVESNTFWFATEPIDVAEFTVTAYGAGDDEVVAKTVDVAEAGKTMSFQYGRVGTFSVSGLETPAKPDTVMDSAKYYYEYSDYGAYEDWGYVVFEDEFLGTLVLNCTFDSGLYLDICEYTGITNSLGVRFDPNCSYFNLPGAAPAPLAKYWVYDSKMNVAIVDGKYSISLDFQNTNGETLVATFVGDIEGLGYPDTRTQLAKPNVTATVSGKTITLRWDPVEGAEGYTLSLYSPDDEKFDKFVTNNQYVFEAQKSNTKYYFKITATVSEDSQTYRTSDESFFEATTEDTDPKMELSESALSFTADGGEKTFTVTLKNTDAAIEYTQEGDWFTVAFSGDTFTVNASANESETDAREGSITVTAGTLLQTIDVTQSKKSAVSTDGADGTSVDKAYTFTTYSTYDDLGGYPVMCLSGAENGATFNFESNTSGAYPTGMHKFNDGAWYPALCEYKINGEAQAVDSVNSVIWVEGNNVSGYTVEYIYIVTDGGNGIYYKYDGKFFI